MTDPRLSTVFDYSNLRLHSDGTRVYQKSTNLRPNFVRTVVQDSRSNWIARDAGGSGKVPTHRKVKKPKQNQDDEDEDDNSQANEEKEDDAASADDTYSEVEGDEGEKISSGKKRKRKSKNYGILLAKRQKYINDFDYLTPFTLPSSTASAAAATSSSSDGNGISGLPDPSPDLLNVIHRFASEFYHERGQLLNISRQYRREKKERDLRRLGLSSGFDDYDTPGSSSDSTSVSEESSDENSSESEMDEDEEGDGQDEEKDEPSSNAEDKDEDEETRTANNNKSKTRSDTKGNSKGKGKQKQKAKQNGPTSRRRVSRKGTKIKRDDNLYIDMYKMFDGSAMMALGMLVQEQIAQMLNPTMPEGWKEEMEKVYHSQNQNKTKNATVNQDDSNSLGEEKNLDLEEYNVDNDDQEGEAEEDSDNDRASKIGAEAAPPSRHSSSSANT